MNNFNEIENLKIDEVIWVVFIFLSIINIFGDECKKSYYIDENNEQEELAKKVFLFTLFISFIVYIYISYIKYKRLQYCYKNNLDSTCAKARFFASVMVVIASFIFLCCQIKESNPTNPSI